MIEDLRSLPDDLELEADIVVIGGGVAGVTLGCELAGSRLSVIIAESGGLEFEDRDGEYALRKLPTLVLNDDKAGKPVGIQGHIGRRPIAAFGNSDGDLQMLQWTCSASGPRFCLYVRHTDAGREWAYDRDSHIGKLDKGLDEAAAKGWTVVSMKDDWNKVFAFE